jgi:hypothetical protein
MAFIKGKQLADSTVTAAKLKLDSGTYNFAQGAVLQASSPSNGSDVATKSYVDSLSTSSAAGLDFKESVFVATTANLSATYSGGVLTGAAAGAISVDGESPIAGQRILVKDQTTASHNGIYTVTLVGDGSNAFTLTRATDADSSSDLTTGAFIFVEAGSDNQNKSFVLQANGDGSSPTLDTDDLTFIQFSGAGQITVGQGLSKDVDQINLNFIGLSTKMNGSVAYLQDYLVMIDAGTGTAEKLTIGNFLSNALNTNSGLETLSGSTGKLTVKAGAGISLDSNGVNAALPQVDSGSPLATAASDGDSTGITISATPAGDSHVRVTVNGVGIKLGDGATTGCDAYFDDGASGARSIADIASGDELLWNGDINGEGSYELETSDIVEIFYNA